ncbi:MAG TPA: cytochrome c3 family protein [Candidatus Krumholzibacteria bacterium]|nr:cytochrome c3 family protein [Candidatus Krumholzibacteria bacterium]
MKKMLGLLCIGAVAVLVPLAAVAGDYHRSATLVCSDCHTMHFSQTHGYQNADGSYGVDSGFPGGFTPLGGAGPHPYLLRNEVNELCLTCHNGQTFAPDVLGPNTNSYVRMAGALNEVSDGLLVQQTGHTLGTTDAAPGSNPSWSAAAGLECTNCHYPHGSSSYRNLAGDPGNYSGLGRSYAVVSYNAGAAPNYAGLYPQDLTKDVYQHDGSLGQLATHYAFANVDFNEPAATPALYAGSAYAFFCKGCHTDFHGAQGGSEVGGTGGEAWLRHPNAVADIGALGGGHSSYSQYTTAGKTNYVKTMSETGTWPAADNTPSCFSCHKSHGNENAFGLIYMKGTGTITEQGDDGTTVKEMCRQCHSQGG